LIITDGVHLVSTRSEIELHRFADSIDLKRCWYQGVRRGHPHYDLTTKAKVHVAILAGAQLVTPEDLFINAWWSNRHYTIQESHETKT